MMQMKAMAVGVALLATLAGCGGPSLQGQGATDGPAIAQSALTAGAARTAPVEKRNYWSPDFERDKS
jgi:hypothetical protein